MLKKYYLSRKMPMENNLDQFVYGEAVYGARALMSQYDYDLIYYLNICEIDFSQRTMNISPNQTDKISFVKAYPNPASTLINFEMHNFDLAEGNVIVEIHSPDGKCVISESKLLSSYITIDIGILKQGIYSYSIKTAEANFNGVLLKK
jgi:hypothetical protein